MAEETEKPAEPVPEPSEVVKEKEKKTSPVHSVAPKNVVAKQPSKEEEVEDYVFVVYDILFSAITR